VEIWCIVPPKDSNALSAYFEDTLVGIVLMPSVPAVLGVVVTMQVLALVMHLISVDRIGGFGRRFEDMECRFHDCNGIDTWMYGT
jgi:hypothetical protein